MPSLPSLHELRRRRGWTIAELVARSGVSYATISRIERGVTTAPRPNAARRLAEALDLDLATCLVAADLAHEDQAAQVAARLSDDGMMAERVCTLVRRVRWTEDCLWHVELLPMGCMERDRVRGPSDIRRETANDQDAIIEVRS